MSIPKIGEGLNSPKIPEENKNPETPLQQTQSDADFVRMEQAVNKAIGFSRQKRENIPILKDEILVFEQHCTTLDKLCLNSCALKDEEDVLQDSCLDDPENSEKETALENCAKKIALIEDEITQLIDQIIFSHPSLKLSKELFSDWRTLHKVEKTQRILSLSFTQEQIINRCVNSINYENEVRHNLDKNKRKIIDEFYQGGLDTSDLTKITFKLHPPDFETHNRGKVAIRITFSLEDNFLFDIYYKPRDASIDEAIISLFRKINQLPNDQKSQNVDLPTYKIINMKNDESFSIWEFVDGEKKEGVAASAFIKGLPDSSEKQILHQKLLRLESICSNLGLSDLHLSNLVFTNLKQENPAIVPIDLESIQSNSETGLFDEKPMNLPNLTETENNLLKDFKKEIDNIPFRFVPIPTSHFLGGLTRCGSFIRLALEIQQSILNKDYQFVMKREELEWLVLNDLLHNDVPFLTECHSTIYYGPQRENRIVAQGKK